MSGVIDKTVKGKFAPDTVRVLGSNVVGAVWIDLNLEDEVHFTALTPEQARKVARHLKKAAKRAEGRDA